MEKKITVLVWRTKGSLDPDAWYRLDEEWAGERCFKDLLFSAEVDERTILFLREVTLDEWHDAEKNGSHEHQSGAV